MQTYVQSGNVVLSSGKSAAEVARACERQIEKSFGLDIDVVTRTRAQLAKVVEREPAREGGDRSEALPGELPLGEAVGGRSCASSRTPQPSRSASSSSGREIYAWHPEGIGRSRLWTLLAGRGLGVTATARNWTTVTKLLELADS